MKNFFSLVTVLSFMGFYVEIVRVCEFVYDENGVRVRKGLWFFIDFLVMI